MVSSRAMYVPTIVLSVLVILGAGSLWGYTRYEDQQYRNRLEAEIARIELLARKALTMDQAIDKARARTLLLDDFRKRTRADLDALNELTRIMQQPTWVSALELTRDGVRLNGETDQAAALLKIVDKSPLFEGSEFTTPIARVAMGETFGIRARREGAIDEDDPTRPARARLLRHSRRAGAGFPRRTADTASSTKVVVPVKVWMRQNCGCGGRARASHASRAKKRF